MSSPVTSCVTERCYQVAGYTDDPAELDKLLARGAERAREIAGQTLRAVIRPGGLPATGTLRGRSS